MRRLGNAVFVLAALGLAGCSGSPSTMPDAASAERDAGADDAGADATAGFDLLIEAEVLELGDVCLGLSSEPVELSIANPSDTTSPPIRASLSGPDADSFQIVSSTCESGVAARAFCSVRLVLSPLSFTALHASLELEVGERSFTVALDGRGVECDGLTLGPSPHGFGEVRIGEVSPPATFTLQNSADGISGVLSASIGGADPGAFMLVPGSADGCSRRALGPGASCTIDVVFAPTSAGTFVASLEVAGDLYGVPSVSLWGMATE